MKYFLLSAAAGLLAASQPVRAQAPSGPFERLPSGTEYRMFRRDAAGRYQTRPLAPPADAPYTARAGQVLTVFLEFRTGRDSVLVKSRQMQPTPQPVALPAQPARGGLEEAVGLLLPGDSAVFRFPADTIFRRTFNQPVPPFIRRAGNVFVAFVSARELLSMADMTARQQLLQAEYAKQAKAAAAGQTVKDVARIQTYLKKNKLLAKKTVGGTYYYITRPGKGLPPKKGQTVRVLYRGTILATGKEFDASIRHGNQPFAFALGTGQVIPGWDQGIAQLNKGSKAILLSPPTLAYGPRPVGSDIPANAVLRFEVELVDFK